MPKTFYSEVEMGLALQENSALYEVILRLQRVEEEKSRKYRYKNGYDKKKYPDCYPYIPLNTRSFTDAVLFVSQYLKKQYPQKTYMGHFNFVDCGCGYPINCMIASGIGFRTTGYEIDTTLVNKYYPIYSEIKQQDILKADYSDFDVIYYYHPLQNRELEAVFEKKVEEEAKVGAIIISALKEDDEITKDGRFKELVPADSESNFRHRENIRIFRKISNKIKPVDQIREEKFSVTSEKIDSDYYNEY